MQSLKDLTTHLEVDSLAKQVIFSDIDLNMTVNPLTGDISRKTDDQAVKQSLKNIILTSYYERRFRSNIGTPIKSILFEPVTPLLGVTIKKAIEQAVLNFEPRIELQKVDVRLLNDNKEIEINIYYYILGAQALQSFNLILERTR